ncbi:MAG: HAD family phosphatase [Clostridia bacterium]|nr:HAD family phosphatase [Clostridia bacterium]
MHTAYIFDFDGTLVDSMPSWAEKVLNILRECGVDYPADVIHTVTPLGDRGTVEYMRDVLGVPLSPEEIFRQMDESALPKYRDEIGIKDGVREYLAHLRDRGCTLHVLTASPHKMVDPCLKRLGIFDWFDNVWSTDDFGMVKSDTAIYHAAAEQIGVDVSDAVFFDDNLTAIRTARAAGMYAVGVYDASSDALAEEIRGAADYYVYSMAEMPETI